MRLTSKIQYRNFEVGEFIEEKKRTCEETIQLIEKFPWEKQREKIVIDLTNPSITIVGANGYLKLALFFNGKFVLHYFDKRQILFTKSFINFKDTYNYISDYYRGNFDVSKFKRENTWLQHNLKHFVSQDFEYMITQKSTFKFLFRTSTISLTYTIIITFLIFFKWGNNISGIGILIILFSMFFIGGGINLLLLFNYYFYAKDKLLIMSKGNDTFSFGNKNLPTVYNKRDILKFTTVRNKGNKSPISGFAIVIIEFKNGKTIKIPNLLVDHFDLEQKLFEYSKIEKGGIPFLKI